MEKISKEMLATAMQCKTADELVELAKSKGYDITQEQAEAYIEQFSSYELTDKELDEISSGDSKWRRCTNYNSCKQRCRYECPYDLMPGQ